MNTKKIAWILVIVGILGIIGGAWYFYASVNNIVNWSNTWWANFWSHHYSTKQTKSEFDAYQKQYDTLYKTKQNKIMTDLKTAGIVDLFCEITGIALLVKNRKKQYT